MFCERLKSQNRVSRELEADWLSWWSCKQLPLPINSCYEAALVGWCILSSLVLELLCLCVCPVGNWNANCGYEEALHSNGEVLVLPEKGDQIGQGIKCQLVKDC